MVKRLAAVRGQPFIYTPITKNYYVKSRFFENYVIFVKWRNYVQLQT